MKITEVGYRRLESHKHGYGHDAFEARGLVEDGETPEQALEALRVWVDGKINASRALDKMIDDNESLVRKLAGKQREFDSLAAEVTAARAVIRKCDKLATLAREHGLAAEADLLDGAIGGIPF